MITIQQFREQKPQYADMDSIELAGKIYNANPILKSSNVSFEEFSQQVGVQDDIAATRSGFKDTIRAIGAGFKTIPGQIKSSSAAAIQGGDVPAQDVSGIDKAITLNELEIQDYMTEHGKNTGDSFLGVTPADVAGAISNLGFSGVSMGTGLVAGAAGTLTPVPGAALVAGTGAMGKASYNMARNQITRAFRDSVNEEREAQGTAPMSDDEWSSVSYEFAEKGHEYGLWEAVLGSIGNVAGFKILTSPLKSIVNKKMADNILRRMTTGAGRLAATTAEELATETFTQKGQGKIEYDIGFRDKPPSTREAFNEVYGQTVALTAIMGVGAKGAHKAYTTVVGKNKPSDLLNPETDEQPDSEEQTEQLATPVTKEDVAPQSFSPRGPEATPMQDEQMQDSRYQNPADQVVNKPDQPQALQDVGGINIGALKEYVRQSEQPVTSVQPSQPLDRSISPDMSNMNRQRAMNPKISVLGQPSVNPDMRFKQPPEKFQEGLLPRPRPPEMYQKPDDVVYDMAQALNDPPDPKRRPQKVREIDPSRQKVTDVKPDMEGFKKSRISQKLKVKPSNVSDRSVQPEMDFKVPDTEIDVQANESATSPLNDRFEPTKDQIRAGNYKKGHIEINDLKISIENPQGSVRKDKQNDPPKWSRKLEDHYGYLPGVKGADKDYLDVFVKPGTELSPKVFVIDQIDPETGKFDESKVMIGYNNTFEAGSAYNANYEPGWKGGAGITEMPMGEFKEWAFDGKIKDKPLGALIPKKMEPTAELIDTGKIPKKLTKKQKALNDYRKFVDTLSENEKTQAGALIEDDPKGPSGQIFKIKKVLAGVAQGADFNKMVKEASKWRGAAQKLAENIKGNKKAALKLSKRTTKGDLDAYLMKKFGVSGSDARSVSNELTDKNIQPDMTASLDDFMGEPWMQDVAKKPGKKIIGQNRNGLNIYEAESGHRAVEEMPGILVEQTVRINPDPQTPNRFDSPKDLYIKGKFGYLTSEEYNKFDKERETLKNEREKDLKKDEGQSDTSHSKVASWVKEKLSKKHPITSKELFEQSDIAYGGTQGQNSYTVKDAYDAMELGINKFIESKGYSPDATQTQAEKNVNSLKSYTKLLATQTKRTKEQNEFQQFSTPPAFAYIANWIAGINKNDVVLEPSAGIGGLAVFAKNSGAKVYVNEFSERRSAFLEEMGFDGVFNEDAAQLDNIIPDEIKPTVVVMNPPFSATAGRTKTNSTMNGARHIEQALSRLQEGGRLVAIVGQGMSMDAALFKNWWDGIKQKYNVRANIGVSGKEYVKYGTTFDNQLIVIDKTGETGKTLTGKVDSFSDLIPVLEGLRKEGRNAIIETDTGNEPNKSGQPYVEKSPDNDKGASRKPQASRLTTDRVGDKKEKGSNKRDTEYSNTDIREDKPEKSDVSVNPEESQREPDKTGPEPDTGVGSLDTGPSSGLPSRDKTPLQNNVEEISDSVYDTYVPNAKIPGSKKHVTPLVESAAMADTKPPSVKYIPNIPKKAIKSGNLTDAQLEAIIYAGESHTKWLDDGSRKGFFIGDGCVDAKTKIYNPITKSHTEIKKLAEKGESHIVLSLTKHGLIPHEAQAPFKKGTAKLYQIILDNGKKITVTNEHRFLTPEGWNHIDGGLNVGHFLSSVADLQGYNLEFSQSTHAEDDQHLLKKPEDCLDRYYCKCRLCDEQLQKEIKTGQALPQSPSGVHGHNHDCLEMDAQGILLKHSRQNQENDHHSRNSFSPISIHDPSLILGQAHASDVQLSPEKHQEKQQFHAETIQQHRSDVLSLERPQETEAGLSQNESLKQPLVSPNDKKPQEVLPYNDVRFQQSKSLTDTLFYNYSSCDLHSRWNRIVSISFVELADYYDMYVPGVENYVAEGFVNHNTGVGKGREIAGIIWDNWRNGTKKAIWLSEKSSLLNDAKRDLKGVGWDEGADNVFSISSTKLGKSIKQKEGILFTQYATLRGKFNDIRLDEESTLDDLNIRLNQIVKWAGKGFDGVIAFDESHNMGNVIPVKGKRGSKKPANQALAGVLLQKMLPKAKIVYVSATGATEVSNLAYATRLGLWGEGTPFKNVLDFVEKIAGSGISAMELVARDMKSLGLYIARSLSYADVKYDRLEHELSPEQTKIYDTLARGWQKVLENIHAAIEETEGGNNARSSALSQFWGAHQRFFNQIITAMQMPTALKQMEKDIDSGNSVVVQLVNTNASQTERKLAELDEDMEIEDLDMTPRESLMQFLERSFPTQQYEEYTDEDGNNQTRPVFDSAGNSVENKKAVAIKQKLLQEMGSMSVPETALDMILHKFGNNTVAEVTGRKRRIIIDTDGKKVIEKWSDAKSQKDIRDFMDDKKQILIFSEKGGTGSSYHAALDAKNQRLRRHYLVQPGWRADKAVQGLGRSHRSFQKQAPEFVLVTTNLPGQKRFLSSIARRLDQLGALTKGQRQTGSQGIFVAKDNLESSHARDALKNFFDNLTRNKYDDLDVSDFERQTGLSLFDKKGDTKGSPEMSQFLNRILSMTQGMQDKVFGHFSNELDRVIQIHSDLGTLDVGLETVKAQAIRKVKEETAYKNENVEAKYVQFELDYPAVKVNFKHATSTKVANFYMNKKSSKVRVAGKIYERTDLKTGEINKYRSLQNPKGNFVRVNETDISEKWEEVSKGIAKTLWGEEYSNIPDIATEKMHLLTGTLLPLWDRLKGRLSVARLQTDSGERYLGRKIDPEAINDVLSNLGMGREKIEMDGGEIADNVLAGGSINLSDSTRLKKSRVAGENRIEYITTEEWGALDANQMESYGLFSEIIQWKTRWFVPSGDSAGSVIDKIIKGKDIVSAQTAVRKQDVGGKPQFSTKPQTESEAFKKWFGDSKVVDDNGDPLVVYHGTPSANIESFDNSLSERFEVNDSLFFVTPSERVAENYTDGTGNIMKVFVSLKNPIPKEVALRVAADSQIEMSITDFSSDVFDYTTGTTTEVPSWEFNSVLTEYAEDNGYDGFFVSDSANDETGEPGMGIALLNPTQIKSATENVGTFDPKDPDIRYASKIQSTGQKVTLKDVQNAFKNQLVGQDINNKDKFWIKTRKGLGFTVSNVKEVSEGKYLLSTESGSMQNGQMIAGKYQDRKIEVVEGIADRETLDHEILHLLEDVGLITNSDKLVIAGAMRSESKKGNFEITGNRAEDRASFLSEYLGKRRDFRNTKLGEILQKIGDFVDSLVNLVTTTTKGIARDIESGKVFSRDIQKSDTKETQFSETAGRWYSQLEKVLSQKLPGKAFPKQMLLNIKAWVKKNEFKVEELEWSGLESWLLEQTGKLSKDDVLGYLKETNVRVQEVVKGGIVTPPASKELIDSGFTKIAFDDENSNSATFYHKDLGSIYEDDIDHIYDDEPKIRQQLSLWAKELRKSSARDKPKFSQYQLPGGKNYKELLLTLPAKIESATTLYEKFKDNLAAKYNVSDVAHLSSSELTLQERADLQQLKDDSWDESPDESLYKSSHWDEPNVLAHVRFSERKIDGKNVLHIEELQSDWHQEGRKKGYKRTKAEINKIEKEYNELLEESTTNRYFDFDRLQKLESILAKEQQGITSARTPQAPFKKTWPILAMKRMVRYAAENGFDSIVWTPGEIQTDRYDLSKQIDSIRWMKSKEGSTLPNWNLTIFKDGKKIQSLPFEDIYEAEPYVGKEIVERILVQSESATSDSRGTLSDTLSGLDLKVGGEGMKGFYDKILPSSVNKFFNKKKWGNAKVGKANLDIEPFTTADGSNVFVDSESGVGLEVHSVEITPEIRQKALYEGMPQFQIKNDFLENPDFDVDVDVSAWKNTLSGIKKVIELRGYKGKNYKPDINVINTTFGLLSHYSDKVAGLKRFFGELVKKPEYKFQKTNELSKDGELSLPGVLADLQKHNKRSYTGFRNYLLKRDVNQIGTLIVESDSGWKVLSEKKRGKRTILKDGFPSKENAREWAIEREVSEYQDLEGRDSLMAFRKMTAKLHDEYAQTWQTVIEEYKKRGLALPDVAMQTETGETRINLKIALAKMGERSSYYFPRQRNSGQWKVIAKKSDGTTFIDYRDNNLTAKALVGKLEAQGYKLESLEKVGKMSEDVFQSIESVLAMQAHINQALAETKLEEKIRGLEDLDLKAYWEDGTLIIQNGDAYRWSADVLNQLGGEAYSELGVGGSSYNPNFRFKNASKDMAEIVTNALLHAKGLDKDISFTLSEAMAEQLADLLRSRGSQARMISRMDAVGKDVPIGYETDPLKAIAQTINSAAGGYAKRELARKATNAITGRLQNWEEFQESHFDYDLLEKLEQERESLSANTESEKARIKTLGDQLKKLQQERVGIITETEKGKRKRLLNISNIHDELNRTRKWTDQRKASNLQERISRIRGNMHKDFQNSIKDNMIDPKRQKNAYNDAISALKNVMMNDEAADRVIKTVRGLTSLWFLGGRISSPTINLTSMGTSVPASMNAYCGIDFKNIPILIGKASKAYSSFATGKGRVGVADRKILEEIESRGWVAAQLNMEVMSAVKSGSSKKYSRFTELMMTLFKVTEEFNRAVTILATYKGIKASDSKISMEDALQDAKTVSDRAHGIYGEENQPSLLRKGEGLHALSSMYIFQTYIHNYFNTMAQMFGERKAKAFIYMGLSGAVFGGIASSPLIAASMMIFKAMGVDEPEEEIYRMAEEIFGEAGSDVARYGLPGLAGISLKGSLAPNLPDFDEPIDVLGPIGGMMRNWWDGAVNITKGNYLKGAEKLLPLAAGNIIKGYRETTQGVTTRSGDPVFYGKEQIRGDLKTGLIRAMGFNPIQIAKPREIQWSETKLRKKYSDEKRLIYNQFVRYYGQAEQNRNPQDWRDTILKARKINARIKSHDIERLVPFITSQSIKTRLKRSSRPTKRERLRGDADGQDSNSTIDLPEDPEAAIYDTWFSKTSDELDKLVRDIRGYQKSGDKEKATELAKENWKKIKTRRLFKKARKELRTIKKAIKFVSASKLDSKKKKERTIALTKRRNDIVRKVYDLVHDKL